VLLADDHPLMRRLLRRALAERDELAVVGEASDGAQAVALARVLAPDLVVLDLAMPVMDGIQAAAALRADAELAGCAILVFSAFDGEGAERRALAAGADRFLDKAGGFKAAAAEAAALALRQAAGR
jgi:DNA-binding NarL/FixJ family response regulator